MNTVKDLRQALADEVRRLQPPTGLEARVIHRALRAPATTPRRARPTRALRSGDSSIEMPRWVALVAALLLVAIVISLVLAVRLLHSPVVPVHPGPPPNLHPANGLIAVAANPKSVGGGEVGDIYLVSEGAAAQRIIGSDGDRVAQQCPRFSPDGRWLAYGEARASDPVTTFRGVWPVSNRAVVVVGVDNRGNASRPFMRVKLPSDPGEIACPKWSPGGRQLAFRFGSELWVADASSGKKTVFPVTAAPWGLQEFEWSRDGSRIAVAEPGQIRVVRVDGGGWTLIPVHGNRTTPASLGWTAGDRGIIYITTDAPGVGLAVNIVGVDGQNNAQLTANSADLQVGAYETVVSPDGARVAYLSTSQPCTANGCGPGTSRLLTMGIDGSGVVELPIPAGFGVSGLQWSPDGKRLLFGSLPGVVSVGVVPGSPAVVYSSGELNLEWSSAEISWQPVFP